MKKLILMLVILHAPVFANTPNHPGGGPHEAPDGPHGGPPHMGGPPIMHPHPLIMPYTMDGGFYDDPYINAPYYNENAYIENEVPPALIKTHEFYRFGMSVGGGVAYGCSYDLSFYVANGYNYIISFGYSGSTRMGTVERTGYYGTYYAPGVTMWQSGAFLGFGQLFKTTYNKYLSLGYLINVHGGYSSDGLLIKHGFVGIEPAFILDASQFLFKVSVYGDTSMIITAKLGFGFLY